MPSIRFVVPALVFLAIPPASSQTVQAVHEAVSTAQQDTCGKYKRSDRCQSLVDAFVHQTFLKLPAGDSPGTLSPTGDITMFTESIRSRALLALGEQARQKLTQAISTSAAVNQVGSPASSGGGSTNLASKPTTTDFLSIASESGAFTDTLNGTSLTLQANANGLIKYLTDKPVFKVDGRVVSDTLQALSFTIGLNVAQSSGSTAATTGSATSTPLQLASVLLPANNASFSSFQANYMFYRPFRPGSQGAEKIVSDAIGKNQAALNQKGSAVAEAVNSLTPLVVRIGDTPEIKAARAAWIDESKAATSSKSPQAFDDFVKAYANYYAAYVNALDAQSGFNQTALALDVAVQQYQAAVYDVMNDVRGKPYATATYTYSTPPQKPATHQGTLVASYLFKGGKNDNHVRTFMTGAQFTGNFTASVYSSLPAGATYGRLRDVQLSSEFDKPIAGTTVEPRAILSLAGYGQYQYDPTVLNITAGNLAPGTPITLPSNAQVLLGTAGWLGVVQGKITINLKPGLSLPVAVKWSNKTDLLQANDVRGQIGLSYDLSALSKLISGQ